MAEPVTDRSPGLPAEPDASARSSRCSAITRAEHADPVGTAGHHRGYLLIEWPLPWPRDLSDVAALVPLTAALAGTGIRLQALVAIDRASERRRVVLYRQRADDFAASYERRELLVPVDRQVAAAIELATTAESGQWEAGSEEPQHATDVLICTHGQRDVCCGASGTALALEIMTTDLAGAHRARIWRTSHTGGHRFAPTAIVLPQGTAWAFLDADALRRVVARDGPLDDLLPRYRGFAGVGPPAVQALEREAFAAVGWPWLDHRRRGRVLADGRVRLEAEAPDGSSLAWEAEVQVRRTLPVPECGRPISEAKKSEPEWQVSDVRPVR